MRLVPLNLTLLAVSALTVGCSSSGSSGNGSGDGGGGGGACPFTIPAGQGPFNDHACSTLTAGDFQPYNATLQGQEEPFATVCDYTFQYTSDQSTGLESVSYNPGCQYDGKRTTTLDAYNQYLAGNTGGPDVHKFLPLHLRVGRRAGHCAGWMRVPPLRVGRRD